MQCSPNFNEDTELDHVEQVERQVEEQLREEIVPETIEFTTPEKVNKIINNLNVKKAPGPDAITNAAIKKLPKKVIAYLINIINICFTLSYFPKMWKKSDAIPIRKPGKKLMFPENYRPISLLSNLAKITERVILNRIQKKIEEIIQPEQHGFRAGYSPVHQCINLPVS